MKNPLLAKEVWDWQDAAVAADWAMGRGVFGAEMWRCFPPEFVRCLAEFPAVLKAAHVCTGIRAYLDIRTSGWVWAGADVGIRGWVSSGKRWGAHARVNAGINAGSCTCVALGDRHGESLSVLWLGNFQAPATVLELDEEY